MKAKFYNLKKNAFLNFPTPIRLKKSQIIVNINKNKFHLNAMFLMKKYYISLNKGKTYGFIWNFDKLYIP
jgi:hypothetical protein